MILVTVLAIFFASCGSEEIINNIVSNEVTAKERLNSAIADAHSSYGDTTNLVLIFGKNVQPNGTTELSALTAITNPDSIGAWLYIFKSPTDTTLRVYTPNPLPTSNGCIELTAFFNINSLLGLIQDTSARNIVSGALDIILTSNITISTQTGNLVDSDVSMGYANNTNPIIKFNANYVPDTSSLNGNTFMATGTNQSRNMFLIPAAGTLYLPNFITQLTDFPNDLWIVNYKKTNASMQTENLILGTVVESNQNMSIPLLGLYSKVINISKYVSE
jgi:hypothetical protein